LKNIKHQIKLSFIGTVTYILIKQRNRY